MSNLSLLSAVAAIGMTDPFSDSGIPSRRIYTLTGQTAQAWSRFLDRAAVGGDPYTTTERPGALEAARAFLDSIPVDRLSRARKATVAKLIRNLESPMSRRPNPAESVRILRAANPRSPAHNYARDPVEPFMTTAAGAAALEELADFLRTFADAKSVKPRVAIHRALRLATLAEADGDLAAARTLRDRAARAIAAVEGGARTGNPYGEPHTQETANIIAHVIATLNNLERLAKKLNDTKTDEAAWDKLARKLIMLQISLRIPTEERIPETMSYRERFDWFRRFAITSDMAHAEGRRPWWHGGPIPSGGARAANPPALIWEFDGEPTSPKALLADNPDNDDVAAAVAYLKKEGAKFSMGRHGTKSVRSWSAVSFGGGAADESVLTVRADWTDGPVFKAVLDASTIPYAGDLPDADSPFSHRAGSDNYQDDFYSDFEEADDDG